MTEHDCDASTSSNSSDDNRLSSSESHSGSRSPSPFIGDNKGYVNLLTDTQFHKEIKELAAKRNIHLNNHFQLCTLDATDCITNVGDDNNRLPVHEFFMDIALLASARSDDPKTKVGACIVDRNNHIIGIGYNHFPANYTSEPYSWGKDKWDPLYNKLTYVIHAESDAILGPRPADLRGSTIYSTLMPCNECAKLIIQSGILNVYYLNTKSLEKWIYQASLRMLDAARVKLQKLE
ncbi:probable deoxycytidylate deaminase [Eurosta solidaginis]|uniref:probable deoxycytidylate deaminase n=1 Tax=Eurosta solidaginis TaxID=178769 RepID=UPI00353064F0